MSDDEMLRSEVVSEGVLVLALNRPDKMNALATPLLQKVSEALTDADGNDDTRVVIITGSDKVFAAGADINELKTRNAIDGLIDLRPSIWNSIRCFRKPLIAAVNGYCLGAGNELLMCADIAVADSRAKFGQPESNLGIIPGAGGATLLPRIVGQQRAMQMVLLGEFITADEALSYGLVSAVTEAGEALATATVIAEKIATRAPLAMIQGKAVVRNALETSLNSGLAYERQAFSMLLSTDDKNSGTEAFLSKTRANWKGQ